MNQTITEIDKIAAEAKLAWRKAIRVNADELARGTPDTTERVLRQACAMISQFKAAYPHRVLSRSVH